MFDVGWIDVVIFVVVDCCELVVEYVVDFCEVLVICVVVWY